MGDLSQFYVRPHQCNFFFKLHRKVIVVLCSSCYVGTIQMSCGDLVVCPKVNIRDNVVGSVIDILYFLENVLNIKKTNCKSVYDLLSLLLAFDEAWKLKIVLQNFTLLPLH